ncbi:MAG TPA: ATP-binding protein [Candidatus Angelobacter sp.]|jgi:hypothetical protein
MHNESINGISRDYKRMKNEYISIISSLCRIGLGGSNPAFRHQVERLTKAMHASGDDSDAEVIEELLKSAPAEEQLKPSRIIPSKVASLGEPLTARVQVPLDKESGAPLADILFPSSEIKQPPVLPDNLQNALEALLEEWGHLEELDAIGAAPSRTCLLFGKPGTGKTRLAYYIGQQLGLPVVLAKLDGLISSFLGTTARNIGLLFDFANRYRCLLLLDEFDALAKLRDDPQEIGEIKRVVNTLLQNIDGRVSRGLTIAITNHESLLDSAVWRRFEIRVEIPSPNEDARKQILARYLPPLHFDEGILNFLAWVSEGLTGSAIETMVRSLKRHSTILRGEEFVFIDALRAFVTTNATAERQPRLELLSQPAHQFVHTVMNAGVRLSQQELGFVLGKDQATISRWLKQDTLTQ